MMIIIIIIIITIIIIIIIIYMYREGGEDRWHNPSRWAMQQINYLVHKMS